MKYTPMIQQYLAIKAQYKDAFLFFRLGDFYELFFEDALTASRELEITLTGRDGGGEERIPMCGVPYHSVDTYIAQLIEKGYKVAICEQVEDPKQAKGVVRREVTRVITPGTVMEGKFLQDKENNYLVSVFQKDGVYALAACDISTGEFYTTEVGTRSLLLDEMMQYRPSEVVLLTGREEDDELGEMLVLYPIVVTKRPPDVAEDGEDVRAGFAALFSEVKGTKESTPAMLTATRGLLSYLRETQKRSLEHLHQVTLYEAASFMVLDQFTRRNLELVETIRDKSKKGSLLWLLDQTVTAMGGRLLRRWIDKPLLSKSEIEKRQAAVQALLDGWMARDEVRACLKEVYDLERLAGRIAYGTASPRDLVQLKTSLLAIPALKQALREVANDSAALQEVLDGLDECPDVIETIDRGIVDDPPVAVKEGGLIKEGYHEYLDKLRTASREGKQWIAALEQQERQATGIRSLKVGYNKVFGYYIEVTKANLSLLPEGRYERKQTLANAERFITPELKEKEALILEAEEKRSELEYQLFVEIREKVAREVKRLQALALKVATVDVLQSLATVAQDNRYVRPEILTEGPLVIRDGRHPVVEAVLHGEPFVPNDTELGTHQQILLITGPNMAGKSTYMRQVALIVIMAQMGSFVPAEFAQITPVDRIFTRIGAADDLVGGQSTFMVEMKEIEVTLTNATERSLVIIDELGRGTSTSEGMSIAQAVIEYLHNDIGCKTLVSTHYHELSHLETTLDRLKNFHMAVNETDNNVIFLRKLVSGPADKSYGIYCAQIAGLPQRIIDRANRLLEEYEGAVVREAAPEEAANRNKMSDPEQEHMSVTAFAAAEEPQQLALFSEPVQPKPEKKSGVATLGRAEEKVLKKLREADLLNMTPMQAMNFLFELKQQV
ncbi:DNA mismatch repair protein MutS [Aneurinibacillus thermoaerophilus]|uniref:DNA mismatch repair protein MutS n=1 Tax=Aneurinibacillus thermoaerophilus TaxID=143495 RepID=A0A1G8DWQ9_ANETH|nr:DNA mismatch repair protein MutS [Aneurinibacillus thermoaerophilus]MED0676727.1 DNA mismatch repair protein MutS [Aneurinibacillus thermoaerophilus]SDH62025.1 DNA mismatch repair protein MutS [Aneurinibacillus thermoaerophilus]